MERTLSLHFVLCNIQCFKGIQVIKMRRFIALSIFACFFISAQEVLLEDLSHIRKLMKGDTMFNIYLVEDEKNLNDILVLYLKNEGYKVKSFTRGLEAEKCIKEDVHLWVLDIMLPDVDGYELIKKIKKHNENIPVIFISARDTDLDIITGLQMGSDDYISKPFLPMELVIRIKKLLNRVYKRETDGQILINNQYRIDFDKRILFDGDRVIEPTSREFDFLCTIIKNKNIALSREYLLNSIWGVNYYGSERVVDDLVRRVRKKLPNLRIETIYGYGYRWCE